MDNRRTILGKALSLFASKGYDAVGVQEIVDAAGITKPTLYHYFGSKKGLMEAIIREYGDPLYDEVFKAADYHGDLPLTLETLAFAFTDFASRNEEFYRMQLAMYFSPAGSETHDAIMELNMKLFALTEDLFKKAAVQHGNMRGRHSAYAASFIGMINTMIGIYLHRMMALDRNTIRKSVHQFSHGIYS